MKQWELIRNAMANVTEPVQVLQIMEETRINAMKWCNKHCAELNIYDKNGATPDTTLYGIEAYLEARQKRKTRSMIESRMALFYWSKFWWQTELYSIKGGAMNAFNDFTEEQVEHTTASMGDEFESIESEDFDNEDELEFDYDVCYECTGYGDDYRYDAETDDLVCNCDDCPYNPVNQDDFD